MVTASVAEPAADRDAGLVQGLILAGASMMIVVAITVALPLSPAIMQAFANQPHIAELAPLVVVLPMLTVAIASIAAGVFGDRIDRRGMLVGSTAVFAVTSVAPAWLPSFTLILASRAVTGLAMGAMITSAVALTGDYYSGAKLQRWLGVQTGAAAVAAVFVAAASGALAEISWRLSYLLLLVGAALFVALLAAPGPKVGARGADQPLAAMEGAGAPVPRGAWIAIFTLALVGTLIAFPPAYELGVLLQEKALGGAMLTGIATATLSAGAAIAAFSLGAMGRMSPIAKIVLAIASAAVGTIAIAQAGSLPPLMLGAALVGAAQGMLGPVLTMWLLDRTPEQLRGRAVGAFQLALCLAGFAAPLIARALAVDLQSSTSAMRLYAIADAVVVVAILITLRSVSSWSWSPTRTLTD